MTAKLHRVVLRWHCEKRRNKLCFRQETHLEDVSLEDLEDARVRLFTVPFSTCACGSRICRSMEVMEVDKP